MSVLPNHWLLHLLLLLQIVVISDFKRVYIPIQKILTKQSSVLGSNVLGTKRGRGIFFFSSSTELKRVKQDRFWRIMCQVKKLGASTDSCTVCIFCLCATLLCNIKKKKKKSVCMQLYARFHDCFCLEPLLACALCLQLHLFKGCSINLTYWGLFIQLMGFYI